MSVGIIAASICVYIALVGDPIFHQKDELGVEESKDNGGNLGQKVVGIFRKLGWLNLHTLVFQLPIL